MPTNDTGSRNSSPYKTTYHSVPVLSGSGRSTVSTSLHTRLHRQEMSTANNPQTYSTTNNSIPLLSWFNRPEMPSADYQTNSATYHTIPLLSRFYRSPLPTTNHQTSAASTNNNKGSSLLPRKH